MATSLSSSRSLIGALAVAAAAAGCMATAPAPHLSAPTPRQVNVTSWDGTGLHLVPAAYYGKPSLNDWTAAGLRTRKGPECGDAVTVEASSGERVYGRLVLFMYVEGQGPAGRGQYLLKVPDERIREASGGRLSMHAEYYRSNDGRIDTAWVVVMSDQPIPCQRRVDPHAPPRMRSISTGRPPRAPDGSAWATPEQCRAAHDKVTSLRLAKLEELEAMLERTPPAKREERIADLELLSFKRIGRRALEIVSAPPAERASVEARVKAELAPPSKAKECEWSTAPQQQCLAQIETLAASADCYTGLARCVAKARTEAEQKACFASKLGSAYTKTHPDVLDLCQMAAANMSRLAVPRLEELVRALQRRSPKQRDAYVAGLEPGFDQQYALAARRIVEAPPAERREAMGNLPEAMKQAEPEFVRTCRARISMEDAQCLIWAESLDAFQACMQGE